MALAINVIHGCGPSNKMYSQLQQNRNKAMLH